MRPTTHNQSSWSELRHQKVITCATEHKSQHKSDKHKHTQDTTKHNRKQKTINIYKTKCTINKHAQNKETK